MIQNLVNGEEGCLCLFDLEFVKQNTKEGLFDPRKMSESKRKYFKTIRRIRTIIN